MAAEDSLLPLAKMARVKHNLVLSKALVALPVAQLREVASSVLRWEVPGAIQGFTLLLCSSIVLHSSSSLHHHFADSFSFFAGLSAAAFSIVQCLTLTEQLRYLPPLLVLALAGHVWLLRRRTAARQAGGSELHAYRIDYRFEHSTLRTKLRQVI